MGRSTANKYIFKDGPIHNVQIPIDTLITLNSLYSADFFSKLTLSKNAFRNTIRVSNSLDTDQDRHSVGPDLGPNCLQKLSADDKSRR